MKHKVYKLDCVNYCYSGMDLYKMCVEVNMQRCFPWLYWKMNPCERYVADLFSGTAHNIIDLTDRIDTYRCAIIIYYYVH